MLTEDEPRPLWAEVLALLLGPVLAIGAVLAWAIVLGAL